MFKLLIISGVFPWAFNLLLGFFVLIKNPHGITNRKFCIFSSSIAFWSVGSFVVQEQIIPSMPAAFFAAKICYFAACFLPILFLDFAYSVRGIRIKNPKILSVLYLFAAALAVTLFGTNLFLVGLRDLPHLHFRVSLPGPVYYLFFSYFCICIIWALIVLFRGIQAGPPAKSNQLKYVFVAYLVASMSGFEYFLTVFGVVPYPPVDDYILILAIPILSYAIVRHRLMDIEVIIRKTLVFAGLFAALMAIVSIVTAIAQSYVGQHFKMGYMISSIVSVLIATALYDPTRKYLIAITDKYLFQKREDIRDILSKLTHNIIMILDLQEVGSAVLNTLKDVMRLESGALLVKSEANNHYEVLNAFNLSRSQYYFSENTPFIQYFSSPDRIANIEDQSQKRMLPDAVSHALESLNAVLGIPLFAHGKLLGLLTMGKKKSDQEFTRDEIDFLPTVAGQVSIALSNARLLEALVQERGEKIKAQNEAKMVSYGKTIAHEIKNALAGLYGPAQFMTIYAPEDLMKIHDKYLKGVTPPVAGQKLSDIIAKMKSHGQLIYGKADEIRVIAKTAEGTLSSDEEMFEDISVKVIWDSAKSEARTGNCRLISYLPDQFIAHGNVVLLQRVFVNLINNAVEAMSERRQTEQEISLHCEYKQMDTRKGAYFEFHDNGPGIVKGVQEKIFNQGFSTKPKPLSTDMESSGHGHGLFMCKETVEKFHGGKIWVESEMGNGTTFKFWIPFPDQAKEKS